jgi:hypothetical protein
MNKAGFQLLLISRQNIVSPITFNRVIAPLLISRQNIVSPITFNRVIAPFLILFIGQQYAFTPIAYLQQINLITQNDAGCNAQMRLLLKASEGLLYTSESDFHLATFLSPIPQRYLYLSNFCN